MESQIASVAFISVSLLLASSFAAVSLVGIHPLDEKYFASEEIKCKDGSKSFKRERLNDDYCDCVDGTDEPGTSACPTGRFYCRNLGSKPQFIFSSNVNDRICDCCDGSDEYDGAVNCPNMCVMGGNSAYSIDLRLSIRKSMERSTITDLDRIPAKDGMNWMNLDDLLWKLTGMKMLIILQILLISCLVILRCWQKRVRSRRRRHR